jgi:L-threonylcarbamoyladenylate synthase
VVAKLYAVKDRPSFNSLIAHSADLAAAARLAVFNDTGRSPGLAGTADPGARALLGRRVGQGGLDTIAVRVPSHPVAQQDLAAFGKPVVAPSANWLGMVSPTTAQHGLHDLRDRIELLISDGPALGIESGRADRRRRQVCRR